MQRRIAHLLFVMAVAGASVLVAPPAGGQVSGLGIAVTPALSSPVTVGAQNQLGLISIANTSTSTTASQAVSVTDTWPSPSRAAPAT